MVTTKLTSRSKEFGVTAIAVLCVITLVYLGVDASREFAATNKSWAERSNHSSMVVKDLNALQRHLGYGGFIHNFKNYVLRRDPEYLVAIEDSIIQSEVVFKSLYRRLSDTNDRNDLLIIERTLNEYIAKKDLALQQLDTIDPAALDRLLRVDDTAALLALASLRHSLEARLERQEREARASFEAGLRSLQAGSFIVIFIVAASVIMIVLLRRAEAVKERLENAYRRVDQLYEESPNALLTVDQGGHVVRVNRKSEELLGYTAEELVGMTVEKLIPERLRAGHVKTRAAYMKAPTYRPMVGEGKEIYALTKDGRELRVDIAISHFTSGEGDYVLLAIVDETERYALLEQLQRARKDAEDANAAKSRFLASMSHEIRTPLNAVLGILQLVNEQQIPADTAHKLGVAKESGVFLLTLINQVLDFAKIESGEIEVAHERFSLSAMLNAIQSMFKFRTDMRGVRFETNILGDAERFFVGDFDHIRQVLFNLTGNAVKFTETGSIDLLARVVDRGENRCRITFEVTDTGPGMSEDELEHVFDEFVQADAGRRHSGGTGLGLSISKRLADAMGGRLEVRSEFGVGTTFIFAVDVAVAENQDPVDAGDALEETHPLRVLVAEDNDINLMIVTSMLERDGHTVTAASNGQVAVDLVQADPDAFDLVLMDIQMPVLDGVQATVSIRQIVRDKEKLPIIALTANAFQDQKMEYLSAGMQHILTKPLEISDLRDALARFASGDAAPAKADAVTRQEDKPGIDIRVVNDLKANMSPEDLAGLAEGAMTRSYEILSGLKNGLYEDAATIGERAHELAGMLANVGLADAARLAKDIQIEAGQGNTDIADQLSVLESELARGWLGVMELFGA